MRNLKYLFFVLFLCLISIKPTYAINFDPYKWNGIQIGSNNGLTFYGDEEKTFDIDLEYFGSISDEMSEKYGLIKAWNGSSGSNGTTYNFLITACSADISFERFANRHNYIVKSVYSTTPCKTQDGWNRKLEYHFVKMTPTGYNVGNSDTFTVTWNTTVTFKNKYSWPNLFEITNVDILTDDEFKSLMNEYENLSKLEEQIQSIRDTNSKLDAQINQNQTIIDQNNQTNNKLDDLNDNLTSTDAPSLGALENSAGWLPAGPVDSILNLPLSLLNNLTTNLNKTCQPVILPIPYVNKDLTLPCVNTLYDDMGISAWVTTIGVIASAFIMFSYLVKLYKWVDDTLSFRENNSIDNWGGI